MVQVCRMFAASLAISFISAPIHAQELRIGPFPEKKMVTILENSAQCELSHLYDAIGAHMPARIRHAKVQLTKKIQNTSGSTFSLAFFLSLSSGHTEVWLASKTLTEGFPVQHLKCSPNTIALPNMRQCLADSQSAILQAASDKEAGAVCLEQLNITESNSAGLNVKYYIISFGPNASYGTQYTRGIQISIPPTAKAAGAGAAGAQ